MWWIGTVALVASVVLVVRAVEPDALVATWRAAAAEPGALLVVLGAYALAFALRAVVWQRILPGLSLGHALAAIHLSLGGNHVLPLRLGEALRVTSVVRRTPVSLGSATASTVMLRAADIGAVTALAAVLGPRVVSEILGGWGWALLVPAAGLWVVGLWWLRRLDEGKNGRLSSSVGLVGAGATAAWVLEATVIWQAAAWAGLSIDFGEAVLVTAVTIVAQSLAVAPAGIGTYEAAATAVLVTLGASAGPALAAAVAAHAIKTAYALVTGAVSLFVPSPGALGRLRLPPPPAGGGGAGRDEPVDERRPVVLFMPAHNEEEHVARVVRRTPSEVRGHPVQCVVIDDGSTDETALRAARAGADVVSIGSNKGLGYAVRLGLAEAVERGAAAIAFCDADGEYAPEELERMVAPILAGGADYVVGSRLSGDIERMLLHRRVGNHLLTRVLCVIARRRITDGQSGYRAFSARAASAAEIIHDFNYAQVLTLDLLAKGFRYAEVPISYCWRTSGRSFVRLGRYLRHVLPAVHAELNSGS